MRFARGGVGITLVLNGTLTVEVLSIFSPRAGGEVTVKVTVPSTYAFIFSTQQKPDRTVAFQAYHYTHSLEVD